MYRLSNRSLGRLKGVYPIGIDILIFSIEHKDCPYDFGICTDGGLRTPEDQYKMYIRGASKKDGYKKKSKHQSGKAIDLYIYINGKASWNPDMLEKLYRHIEKIAIEEFGIDTRWGGDWDEDGIRVDKDKTEHFLDGGHIEFKV